MGENYTVQELTDDSFGNGQFDIALFSAGADMQLDEIVEVWLVHFDQRAADGDDALRVVLKRDAVESLLQGHVHPDGNAFLQVEDHGQRDFAAA